MSKYHLSPYIRLVIDVAKQAGVAPECADKVIQASFENIMALTAEGQAMRFIGFGTFSMRKRQARKGRNPRTGESLNVPEMNKVYFKPSVNFKKAANPVREPSKSLKEKAKATVVSSKDKPVVKKKTTKKK